MKNFINKLNGISRLKKVTIFLVIIFVSLIYIKRDIFLTRAGSGSVSVSYDENGVMERPRDISLLKNPLECVKDAPWGRTIVVDKVVDDRSLFICQNTYFIQYDPLIKSPLWAMEVLETKDLKRFNMPKLVFNDDKRVPRNMQPTIENFKKIPKGYSVGLLANLKNRYRDANLLSYEELNELNLRNLKEAFIFTNAFPIADSAKAITNKINEIARDEAVIKKRNMYIVSGLIFLNGKVNGEIVDGESKLLIPTHIYKVVVSPQTYASVSYIIPNTNLPCGLNCNPGNYITTIQEVERVAGINLFNELAPIYAVQVKRDKNQILK